MRLRKEQVFNSNRWFIVAAMFFASCNDLLEEDPFHQLSPSTFISDITSLDAVVTAAYYQLINQSSDHGLGGHRTRAMFCGADDWTTQAGGNKQQFRNADQLAFESSDALTSLAAWDQPYDIILQSNLAIFGGNELIANGDEDEEIVNAKIAEVHFLRAWAYFWLVRMYGAVPIVLTHRAEDELTAIRRSSVRLVYNQILDDLGFAINYLPDLQEEAGRVTSWAAKALRSKVYLTMAGWPLKNTAMYANALQDAQDVIDSGPFSLEASFQNIFDIENEANNTETIWKVIFCSTSECSNTTQYTPFASQATRPNDLGGWGDLFIEHTFFAKFPEGVRKDFTFLTEIPTSSTDPTLIPYQVWGNSGHPHLAKFYSGSVDRNTLYASGPFPTTWATADLDFAVLRFTELYFIYAEAAIMGGGGDVSVALEYVNMIRRRAKGVDMNSPDIDDLDNLTPQNIIDERGWEFVGEMKRWFDLTRTESLAKALAARDSIIVEGNALLRSPTEEHYTLPLPDFDVSLNPNLLLDPID